MRLWVSVTHTGARVGPENTLRLDSFGGSGGGGGVRLNSKSEEKSIKQYTHTHARIAYCVQHSHEYTYDGECVRNVYV